MRHAKKQHTTLNEEESQSTENNQVLKLAEKDIKRVAFPYDQKDRHRWYRKDLNQISGDKNFSNEMKNKSNGIKSRLEK